MDRAAAVFFHSRNASCRPFQIITADPNTGKDRPRDKSSSKQLEAAFEAAAQASIRTK